jgi:hypothetical protein
MINRANGCVLLRIALAGCLLVGCFVPIYYAYKAYETDKMVGIAVNVNRPAPEVYEIVIQQIEKNKKFKIVKRDDKDMVLSVQKIANEKETGTVTVSALSARSSRYSAVGPKIQGVDPAVQKQDALNSVLSLCATLGHECTPEEPKK